MISQLTTGCGGGGGAGLRRWPAAGCRCRCAARPTPGSLCSAWRRSRDGCPCGRRRCAGTPRLLGVDGCRDAGRGSRRRCNERGRRRGRGAPPSPRRYGTEPPTVRAMTTVILMYGPARVAARKSAAPLTGRTRQMALFPGSSPQTGGTTRDERDPPGRTSDPARITGSGAPRAMPSAPTNGRTRAAGIVGLVRPAGC